MDNKISLWEKIFSKLGYKLLLFLVSYILVVGVITIIILGGAAFEDLLFWYYFLSGLLLFPSGLKFIFPDYLSSQDGFGYILWYLIVILCATLINNPRTAKILYFIFVSLLILNIYGCMNGGY